MKYLACISLRACRGAIAHGIASTLAGRAPWRPGTSGHALAQAFGPLGNLQKQASIHTLCRIVSNLLSRCDLVSRAKSSPGPEVVAGSGTIQISNITDVISMLIHITLEHIVY